MLCMLVCICNTLEAYGGTFGGMSPHSCAQERYVITVIRVKTSIPHASLLTLCVLSQGVLLPEIGSIILQSGGACTLQQPLPVLHLSNSLQGRLESEESAEHLARLLHVRVNLEVLCRS